MIMFISAPVVPLLAAGFDWLEAVLPFLFVVIWIISQIMALVRRVSGGGADGAPAPRPEVIRELPRRLRPLPPAAPPVAGDSLERQIEEFKRARQGMPAAGGRAEPPPVPRPNRSPRPAPATLAPLPQRRPAPASSSPRAPRAAEASTPQRAPLTDTSLAPGGLERPTPLPQFGKLDARQTEVDRHVSDAFAHDLGHRTTGLADHHLAGAREPAAAAEPAAVTQADELVRMLSNPQGLRQLILLREVLDRPLDRW